MFSWDTLLSMTEGEYQNIGMYSSKSPGYAKEEPDRET